MKTQATRGPSAGFTLVEALASVVMASVLMATLYSFYRAQFFALSTEETKLNLKQTSDVGLEFIVRELRMAGARPEPYPVGCSAALVTTVGCAGFIDLTEARATRLTLLYDFRGDAAGSDPDGCPNDAGEQVTYAYDAAAQTITRDASDGAGAQVLARNVAGGGLAFQYLAADGSVLDPGAGTLSQADRLRVDRIVVTVAARSPHPDPRVGGNLMSTKSTVVSLRNPTC